MHRTTILEENETLRGSIDRHPGSKLGNNNYSGAKRINRLAEKKGANQQNMSAAGARKGQNGIGI